MHKTFSAGEAVVSEEGDSLSIGVKSETEYLLFSRGCGELADDSVYLDDRFREIDQFVGRITPLRANMRNTRARGSLFYSIAPHETGGYSCHALAGRTVSAERETPTCSKLTSDF